MDIHEKIIQLRRVIPENGATEAETVTALELANKLMEKYGISEQNLRQVQFSKDMRLGTVDNQKKTEDPTVKLCGVAIARFCEVRAWRDIDQGMHVLRFFGLDHDVEMAEFLYEIIRKAMNHGWGNYLKENNYPGVNRHKLYWSYRYGFASRIKQKLDDMVEKRTSKGEVTGTDLIVLKEQLVEQALKEMFPSLDFRKRRGSKIELHNGAFNDGMKDGDRVNLNRPLYKKTHRIFLVEGEENARDTHCLSGFCGGSYSSFSS